MPQSNSNKGTVKHLNLIQNLTDSVMAGAPEVSERVDRLSKAVDTLVSLGIHDTTDAIISLAEHGVQHFLAGLAQKGTLVVNKTVGKVMTSVNDFETLYAPDEATIPVSIINSTPSQSEKTDDHSNVIKRRTSRAKKAQKR